MLELTILIVTALLFYIIGTLRNSKKINRLEDKFAMTYMALQLKDLDNKRLTKENAQIKEGVFKC